MSTQEYKCPECGRTFGNAQGLAAHRRGAHGVPGRAARESQKAEAGKPVFPRFTPPVREEELVEAPVGSLVEKAQRVELAQAELDSAAMRLVAAIADLRAHIAQIPGAETRD